MKQYAISDIHGCAKTFEALLDSIGFSSTDELYLLGDYINKGPDSKGVLDLILALKNKGYSIHCLRGNHEQMYLEILQNPLQSSYWFEAGQPETLQSFGIHHASQTPERYLDFIKALPYYQEIPGFLMVHAGLNFRHPAPLQDTQAMLWQRQWYQNLNREWLGDRIIIHGHTPTRQKVIEQSLRYIELLPVLDIDAGCPYDFTGMGHLCAFNLTDRQLYFQTRID